MIKKGLRYLLTIVPAYGLFPLIFSVLFNNMVYVGARSIAYKWPHYNIESSFDLKLPFLPEFFSIYLACFLFWTLNYILIARQDRESVYRFFTADFISKCICLFCFLIFPTTNTRPELLASGFWNQIARILYAIDAPDNLFPSIHCLVSWFCYLGIRDRAEISPWYKRLSCIFALLVFLSTLFTKQHVLADVVGGVFLASFCFWLSRHTLLYKKYEYIGARMEQQIRRFIVS